MDRACSKARVRCWESFRSDDRCDCSHGSGRLESTDIGGHCDGHLDPIALFDVGGFGLEIQASGSNVDSRACVQFGC